MQPEIAIQVCTKKMVTRFISVTVRDRVMMHRKIYLNKKLFPEQPLFDT